MAGHLSLSTKLVSRAIRPYHRQGSRAIPRCNLYGVSEELIAYDSPRNLFKQRQSCLSVNEGAPIKTLRHKLLNHMKVVFMQPIFSLGIAKKETINLD